MHIVKKLFLVILFVLLFPAVTKAQTIIRDDEIERGLQSISAPIFKQAGLGQDDIRFIIVENNEMNAFVAGGMNIFLFTGLILSTENVQELLGVIAHETGHIALGHLPRQRAEFEKASVQSILSTILGIATAIGTGQGDAGIAITRAGQDVALKNLLSHSRTQEAAADQAAVTYFQKAGQSPKGLKTFMQKLADEELLPTSQQTAYLRTHPLSKDRVIFLEHAYEESRYKTVPPSDEVIEKHARMVAKIKGFVFPNQALQNKNSSVAWRYGAAIAHYRKNDSARALKILDELIAEEPHNPYFHELKGQIFFETGKIKESIAPYEQALRLLPTADLIRMAYANALLEYAGNDKAALARALNEYKRIVTGKEKNNPSLHRQLARAYGRIGEEKMAQLHLAEEALLIRDYDRAILLAERVQASFKKGSLPYLNSEDIIATAERLKNRKK